ncbi:hydrolase [Devosia sp. Root436]|uniref:HAD-IIB family hydrolase n=1 Tax=Devosia sp. Root436 TaxID=1736537 RepID=UPI0006F8548A|nr:HAD-IIB family hydrolase [Devosia sp. Root436]KQX40063.1 hydrolase [Devosia sp. Root436]
MIFRGLAPLPEQLQGVRYLFTDIDDTLTTGGRLLPETYQALWDLHAAGIAVIPVTGGSAGWCEHIVRAWPVAAAIGESGALAMTLENGQVEMDFWDGEAVQAERQAQHLHMVEPLLQDFVLARDQRFRLADLAIDITGRSRHDVDALADRIRALGARVAISSIHINSWIGNYDKQTMSERLLRRLDIAQDEIGERTAFVGDSRNDAPMFGYFRNAFGVANILPVLDDIATKPRWISSRPAGLGFVDIARTMIAARGAAPTA